LSKGIIDMIEIKDSEDSLECQISKLQNIIDNSQNIVFLVEQEFQQKVEYQIFGV
jgi:hypothetical protein